MEDDARQFIEKLENRFGGPVGYRTYSTWFASDDGTVREFGVFIHEIGGVFRYEDFERRPSMFGFPIRPGKNQKPYVKMEGSFTPAMIESVSVISKNQALSIAQGERKQETVAPAGGLRRLFSQLVTRIVLKDGRTLFFELINRNEFIKALKEDFDGRVQSV